MTGPPLEVIAPSRRVAFRWCRENGHDPAAMRWISRPEQLLGLPEGTGVLLVDRGACAGTVEQAEKQAYRLEKAGKITVSVVFTATASLVGDTGPLIAEHMRAGQA